MKTKILLTDIDGTLTAVDCEDGMAVSIPEYFRQLAGLPEPPPETADLEALCPQYGVDVNELNRLIEADLAQHTRIRPDAAGLLHRVMAAGIHVYTATTNSRAMSLMKLRLGGFAEKDFAGFFSGNTFHDPRGKYDPDFFKKILHVLHSDGSDAAMLGDSEAHDFTPALNAGIKTVILVDLKAENPVAPRGGGFVVNSLEQVWALL